MNYRSVCSGIEAATVAWEPLGWRPLSFSEIEPFPCSLLGHRFPNVPNVGDMTKFSQWRNDGETDVLVGGTPCQSFSVAGLRKGLADPRGNLALVYLAIADRFRPTWIVWENVPGVLSSNRGRDFGAFLAALGQLGYGWSYRVLDAQHFGVPQRRRRVFVVGHLGDWRRAAAVLFECNSLFGNPSPRSKAGKAVAALTAKGVGTCGADDNQSQAGHLIASTGQISHCLNAGGMGRQDYETETLIAHTLRGTGFDASEDGTGRGTPLVSVAFQSSQSGARTQETHATLDANNGSRRHNGVIQGRAIRRLTPRECERLQGFPDDWTLVPHKKKPAADGPRYKAIGNSMAVPVMRWIGERIKSVSQVL